MSQSDARITMYLMTSLRHSAVRKASEYRRRGKREILLFDAPVDSTGSKDKRTWGEFIALSEEGVEEKVTRDNFVKQMLFSLPPRERQIIVEIFLLHHNELQIAQKLGICQQRVSQLKKQALLRMRAECERQGVIP